MKLIVEEFKFPITLTDDDKGMSEGDFFEFCQRNPALQLERDAKGNIVIMSPLNFQSANFEALLIGFLQAWALKQRKGLVCSSQAGFTLSNGAVRSPDASWLSDEQVRSLSEEEREQFARIAPAFVAEIRSKTDRLPVLQAKMEEYMANGVRLGFLIDPIAAQAWVYRPNREPVRCPELTGALSGEEVLPGFELDLAFFKKQ